MGKRLGKVTRFALTGVFVLLSLLGVPAMAYVLRPDRAKDDVAVELVLSADHVL